MPISGNELLILLVLAAVLVGPERLPDYVRQLRNIVRGLRELADGAQSRIAAEIPEVAQVDWAQLDPRRYDPRRIVREALFEQGGGAPTRPAPRAPGRLDGPAPFDDEAT